MIVTLSGVTGTGKSFFKNTISEELCFKNIVIVTTREKRIGEVNGIVDFEFLGSKYAYRKADIDSNVNQVTEVHYSTIYEFKKNAKNVFSIYMIPKDLERAKQELRKRNLSKETEQNV